MALAHNIVGHAENLFDVVGLSQLPDKSILLIVGLETTPERDLDEFHRIDGNFHITGYEKHAKPKLESLLNLIRKQNFTAELIGRYGYPLKGEVELKEAAVRAGLGRWGKNILILHPKYGNRLRFIAIKTDAPLEFTVNHTDIREKNPTYDGCSIYIDACPMEILKPYTMPEVKDCLANVSNIRGEDGRLIACDICLWVCPANIDTFE